MSRQILKERNSLAKTDHKVDDIEQILKKQFSDYSLEFPTVFSSIVHQGVFYAEPFTKFIQFKKKQPRIYTAEEDSLRDLCRYPLLLWKYMNPHYDEQVYRNFKTQLQEDIRQSYVKTKQEFKTVNQEFQRLKDERASERKRSLVQDILSRLMTTP